MVHKNTSPVNKEVTKLLKLRKARQERGWSLTTVTMKTGIPEPTLSGLESGKVHPYPGYKRRLAKALGIPKDELFEKVEGED